MNSNTGASSADRLKAALQYPLPQHAISRAVHWLTRIRQPAFKNWITRKFIHRFGVDMTEAVQPDPTAYPTFNAFFTRALRHGTRPLASEADAVACPVDGTVSQAGNIVEGRIFQAKGQSFTTAELFGGETASAAQFDAGIFTTLYLSPRDYHRIHMPFAGTLTQMIHVPGRLFSVNPPTTRAVPRLFARNERVVTVFDTGVGPMAVIMVGALNVGSIETIWAGEVTPPRGRKIRRLDYRESRITLDKGAELGRFNMGSTVILLFAADRVRWESTLAADQTVRMGQRIATLL
ncbi:MAG TPA: archaetidylserine decarboxylase [Gammaproteobacteria bacterium]|jgi:phosphatidylserine decarboxylase|nr:archaetidylserine decarboxylase [Gammaproteobacteria bacterium]